MAFRTGYLAVAALVLAACGTTGAGPGDNAGAARTGAQMWRKVTQVEQRTAAFVSQPAAREGDVATFALAFVYAPGQIKWEEKPVAWQVYEAVAIDCAKNQVRLGKRTRYDEAGAAMMSDEDSKFADITYGTVADDAAVAVCKNRVWVDDARFRNGAGWIDQARANLSATPAKQRPTGWSD